jgi:hypothetical protein
MPATLDSQKRRSLSRKKASSVLESAPPSLIKVPATLEVYSDASRGSGSQVDRHLNQFAGLSRRIEFCVGYEPQRVTSVRPRSLGGVSTSSASQRSSESLSTGAVSARFQRSSASLTSAPGRAIGRRTGGSSRRSKCNPARINGPLDESAPCAERGGNVELAVAYGQAPCA